MIETGKRVLIVEDEVLIALDTQDALTEAGYVVVGPATDITSGLAIVEAGQIDAAVLDVYLGGIYVWPVADALRRRGVPFVLMTGFGAGLDVPDNFQSVPRLGKPIVLEELLRAISSCLKAGAPKL
jgi:DNA-binding response OmpR family regulator